MGVWRKIQVYVVNGEIAYNVTTLVEYNDVWYYVKNGKVDFSYTGTFFYGGAVYPVKKGKVIMEDLRFQSIYVMGAAVDTARNWLNGESWKPDAEANRATENGDGEYSIVFYNVPAGRYEFVFAANGDEEYYWGTIFPITFPMVMRAASRMAPKPQNVTAVMQRIPYPSRALLWVTASPTVSVTAAARRSQPVF